MSLATQLTNDLSVFFNVNDFAVSVVYTPYGGVAKTISIIEDVENASLHSDSLEDEKVILLKYDDINTPYYHDSLVLRSETWYVVRNYTGGFNDKLWKLGISKTARRSLKYRGQPIAFTIQK
jgi:hypothetical protein